MSEGQYKVFKSVEVQVDEYVARLRDHVKTRQTEIENIKQRSAKSVAKQQLEIDALNKRIDEALKAKEKENATPNNPS